MANNSSTFAWRSPWNLVGYSPRGHRRVGLGDQNNNMMIILALVLFQDAEWIPFFLPEASPEQLTQNSCLLQNLPVMWETWVLSLGWEDPLEKGTATHFSILSWRIPWTV